MYGKPAYRIIGAALLAALLSTCAVQQTGKLKDGRMYGVTEGTFRAKWWNFYERAGSWADGEFWAQAEADLQEAIAQRDEDKRRARTYGLHFIDYFPRRELGVVYFHQQRFDEAVHELEKSLEQVDTAKAKFYLNKARAEQLKLSGADTAPPSLALPGFDERVYTTEPRFTVNGEARDDRYVAAIAIGSTPVFFELAEPVRPFAQEIELQPGLNRLEVRATDLLDREAKQTIEIMLDQRGPGIVIESPIDGQVTNQGRVEVRGRVTDDSPYGLKIAGRTVKVAEDGRFAVALKLRDGVNTIKFEAADEVGNKSGGDIMVQYDPTWKPPTKGTWYTPRRQLVKAASAGPIKLAGWLDRTRKFFERAVDRQPPEIEFKDLMGDTEVYLDRLFLEGTVRDVNDLESFTINGKPAVKRLAPNVFFARMVMLDEGLNEIVVVAEDVKGNQTRRVFRVTRKIPKVLALDARMTSAVVPFKQVGMVQNVSEVAFENLNTAIVDQHRFNLVEREKFSAILQELEFNQQGIITPGSQAELGELVAAETLIVGVTREMPDSIEVYARLVNTETSEIIAEDDVFHENKSLSNLRTIMDGLALKMWRKFPLIEGKVLNRGDDGLTLSIGRAQGLNEAMDLIVYREVPVEGARGYDTIEIGWIDAGRAIGQNSSFVDVDYVDFIKYIEPNDRVITR